MVISTNTDKAFDRIQDPLMVKTLNKFHVKVILLSIMKVISDKLTVNITLNGSKLKAFPPRSGTRQEWLL
jgi:archaellum component FlaF (FlaF/FlaG flagellin family)